MTRRWFGTDGIRGRVGSLPMTPEFVLRLGQAAGKVLLQSRSTSSGVSQSGASQTRTSQSGAKAGRKPVALIGKDTRLSGYMLEAALEAGLSSMGVDVRLVGPLPTPGVAYLTRALRLDAGIVISASHNPYEDNGIKFSRVRGISCLMRSRRKSRPTCTAIPLLIRSWLAYPQPRWVEQGVSTMQRAAISSFAKAVFHSALI